MIYGQWIVCANLWKCDICCRKCPHASQFKCACKVKRLKSHNYVMLTVSAFSSSFSLFVRFTWVVCLTFHLHSEPQGPIRLVWVVAYWFPCIATVYKGSPRSVAFDFLLHRYPSQLAGLEMHQISQVWTWVQTSSLTGVPTSDNYDKFINNVPSVCLIVQIRFWLYQANIYMMQSVRWFAVLSCY